MPDYRQIYQTFAADYDRLVTYEDYQQNLLGTLQDLAPLAGQCVVELGAGTGRLTRILAPHVQSIIAGDFSSHMLQVARQNLADAAHCHWVVADNRAFPLPYACADMVIAGWSLGHLVEWAGVNWAYEIGKAVAEMKRLVKAGGILIILETMGTGTPKAQPPTEGLMAYYSWLEKIHKFTPQVIRTDYQFPSVDEGERLLRFFFGNPLAMQFRQDNQLVLQEFTGIWWLRPKV